jgi:hypothetical protein
VWDCQTVLRQGEEIKSLFASFSSEKEDSCSFSEEKEPKRLFDFSVSG